MFKPHKRISTLHDTTKNICGKENNLLELHRIQHEAQLKAQQSRNINTITPLHELYKKW